MARITTDSELLLAVQDAEKLHPWPPEIIAGEDAALDIFNKAQQQRAHRDWPPADLVELARAVKLIALADAEFEAYTKEGVVIAGGKSGTARVENPRGRAVATMNSTINSILRRLGLTSLSVSDKRSQANRGAQERRAREDLGEVSDETDPRRLI